MKKHISRSRGFTLIELLVVITIIAILSGIILVALQGSRGKARDAERVSDVGQIQLALTLFFDRCGQYPNAATLSTSSACPTDATITLGNYIGTVPVPPSGAGQTSYDYVSYKATSSGLRVNYILHAKLESNNAAVAKGIDAANIYDSAGASGAWSKNVTGQAGVPFSNCSSGSSSTDYCIGPN